MTRTTIDIDASVLRELKQRQQQRGTTLGRLVSELLATALSQEGKAPAQPKRRWISEPMGLLIDLEDKEAVRRALDGEA